ncbi:hypothetical protein TNCV_4021411 [Trichonephila clavipes]|nr:hypothetical protein TNCV_4021411 [Trichonephila clavipes]
MATKNHQDTCTRDGVIGKLEEGHYSTSLPKILVNTKSQVWKTFQSIGIVARKIDGEKNDIYNYRYIVLQVKRAGNHTGGRIVPQLRTASRAKNVMVSYRPDASVKVIYLTTVAIVGGQHRIVFLSHFASKHLLC